MLETELGQAVIEFDFIVLPCLACYSAWLLRSVCPGPVEDLGRGWASLMMTHRARCAGRAS